jgi:uncharacterized protein
MGWIEKLVGRSPIRPMQEHMKAAAVCAREIIPLVEAMATGDKAAIRERRTAIDRLEHAADEIKHDIRSHLPRRLMLPVERRDLLEILDFQDSIADVTQDVAELADQRAMHLPAGLVESIQALAARVVVACDQAERIVAELDELLETGFAGREASRVEEMIAELGRIESETDALQDTACRKLFALEDELGIATVYWHQIILWIADIADYAERVGNRLRLLIAS